MNKPTHLIIHHSGVQTPYSQFNAIDNYHKSVGNTRSSLGFYIGYHKHIAPNGYVTTARADSDDGEHTLLGWNRKSIGVCLDGDFNKGVPTQAQLTALRALIKQYSLPYMFHKEADTRRTCAGVYFTKELLDVKPQLIPSGETDKAKALQRHYRAVQIAEKTGLPLQWILNFIALGE